MAATGHWFTAAWLQAKLAFVLVLSGVHGIQSNRLRRLAEGGIVGPMQAVPIILACSFAIAVLAMVRPF